MVFDATLVSWTPSTGALTYSVNNVTRTSTVVSSTKTRRAQLNRYQPSDPIIPIVTRWNNLIDAIKGPSTFGNTNPPLDIPNTFSGITSDLAAAQANMKIFLNPSSNVVDALHPIPFIPPNPV